MFSINPIRLAVTLFFLFFVVMITAINYLNVKKYAKNEKLKNIPFMKPAWVIIVGIIFSLVVIYLFLFQPGLPK